MGFLEKVAGWFRPMDIGRALEECRVGLVQEGFLPEADDFASLNDLGGDRYEAAAAIGATAASVAQAIRGRASAALLAKIDLVVRAYPANGAMPYTAASRREGFRSELFRADRLLRDAGFAEASAAAYQLAKRLANPAPLSETDTADLRQQFERVVQEGKATTELRAFVERLARWAADPKRYVDRA